MLEPLELQRIHKGKWQASILVISRWTDSLRPFTVSTLLYSDTLDRGTCVLYPFLKHFACRRNKLQWDHNSGSLFSCNRFCGLELRKNMAGILIQFIWLPTHADKSVHDRSALGRQGGDLKLMVFTTIFFTADLTSKPNSDTAISKSFPIRARRTSRYMPPRVALSSRASKELINVVLRWTVLSF